MNDHSEWVKWDDWRPTGEVAIQEYLENIPAFEKNYNGSEEDKEAYLDFNTDIDQVLELMLYA